MGTTGRPGFPTRKIESIFDVGLPTFFVNHLITNHLASPISGKFPPPALLSSDAWSGPEDRPRAFGRGGGKSELRRAAGWLTARRGDTTDQCNRKQTADLDRKIGR